MLGHIMDQLKGFVFRGRVQFVLLILWVKIMNAPSIAQGMSYLWMTRNVPLLLQEFNFKMHIVIPKTKLLNSAKPGVVSDDIQTNVTFFSGYSSPEESMAIFIKDYQRAQQNINRQKP